MPRLSRDTGQPVLYLVALSDDADAAALGKAAAARHIGPGLCLIRSKLQQPQLYHALERRFAPDLLVVARLADAPKFKGTRPGALKWLRAMA